MRVIVTGGSGFIGTNLVDHFLSNGHQVLNLDTSPPRNAAHQAHWRRTDLLDATGLLAAVNDFDPEVVLHMAARTDLGGQSIDDYPANTTGVSNLIAALKTARQLRLTIFASSMLVCRIGYQPRSEDDYQPSTPYGQSKIDGEIRVRKEAGTAFPWIILRPTSIWGPWFGSPYRDFFENIARGFYVHPRNKNIRRNYGFVLNSVYQIDRLVSLSGAGQTGRTIYMADYEPIELKSWGDQIQRQMKVKPIREVPLAVFRWGAKIGDALKALGMKNVPLHSFRLNNLLTECLLDVAPMQAAVGPLPHDMANAVAITCDWMKSPDGQRR